nr:MAG: branched-chain amino acid ABC transporter ATP-binding protein [Pseudomonadota bacterium]
MLSATAVCSGYGPLQVLHEVSLEVGPGEIVCLLGANGAGKSTLLRTVSGLLRCRRGDVRLADRSIANLPPDEIVRAGLSHVPEGRQIFGGLNVLQNLMLGAYTRRKAKAELQDDLDGVYQLFPVLRAKAELPAASLSGGEQQMLAIGRALMARPRFLALDEPSLGLAPLMIRTIFRVLQQLRDRGVSILIVEQRASDVLALADRGYIMEHGRITAAAQASELFADDVVRKKYLAL